MARPNRSRHRSPSGLEATPVIRKETPQSEIMIFSQHDASQMRQAALQAGARGYVAKSDAVRDLLAAIEAVSQHLQPSSPEPGIHSSM